MAHGASTAIANGFFVLEDGINIAALAVGSIPEYSGSGDSEAGIAPAGRFYFQACAMPNYWVLNLVSILTMLKPCNMVRDFSIDSGVKTLMMMRKTVR
jgi:hypothetical protein